MRKNKKKSKMEMENNDEMDDNEGDQSKKSDRKSASEASCDKSQLYYTRHLQLTTSESPLHRCSYS
jgi:hypothetical protein